MMPTEYANNYDQLFADGFKRRFRSAEPETGETPIQFLTRLDNYLLRWIELAKAEKNFKGLKTLVVQEQYLSICPKEMAMHLKERKPRTIRELGEVAENYAEAHATDIVFETKPRQRRIRDLQADMRRCHICGETGHIRNQSPSRLPYFKSPSPTYLRRYHHRRIGDNNGKPSSKSQRWDASCALCNKPGHIARNSLITQAAAAELPTQEADSIEFQGGAAASRPLGSRSPSRNSVPPRICRKHNWADCGACLNPPHPTHHTLTR